MSKEMHDKLREMVTEIKDDGDEKENMLVIYDDGEYIQFTHHTPNLKLRWLAQGIKGFLGM